MKQSRMRNQVRRTRVPRGNLLFLSILSIAFAAIQASAQTAVPVSVGGASGADDPSLPPHERGEKLFGLHCVMCHQPGATGKVGFAPSIHNRDFLALASDDFIRQSIKEGRPGTAMVPRPDLIPEQVDAIIAFLRSGPMGNIVRVSVDSTLRVDGDREAGEEKFAVFCAACHGKYGDGYMAAVPGTGIGLPGFLNVAPDDYILQTLKRGRLGTPMQPFIGARGLANLSEQDAYDIIAHLRYLGETYPERMKNQVAGPGNSTVGEVHFNINCSACHQVGGAGKVGFAPAIRNPDFLAIASDEFIRETVYNGRLGTGMVARPDLPKQVVNDIIAFLRSLPVGQDVAISVDPSLRHTGDAEAGKLMFASYCASCHGPNGEGYAVAVPGPGIGLPGFLNVASDDYIFQTLKRGRAGTPMKPFLGASGLANLAEQDAYDIIAHLRVLEEAPPAAPVSAESEFE